MAISRKKVLPLPTLRPVLRVSMTPEQQSRQDRQVAWLERAIAAQHRMPTETLDERSLTLDTGCGPASSRPSGTCRTRSST